MEDLDGESVGRHFHERLPGDRLYELILLKVRGVARV
jgi:hypothetical protein